MPGPIGILDQLPPDHQELLRGWLQLYSLREVIQKLHAEPPKGLGIRVHFTTLQRYKQRFLREKQAELLEFAESAGLPVKDLPLFPRIASVALHEMLLQVAATGDPAKLRSIMSLYSAFENTAQRKEKGAFAEEQIRFARQRHADKQRLAEQRLALQKLKMKLEAEVRLSLPPNLPAEKRFAALRASFAQELSAIDSTATADRPLTTDH